MTRSTLYPASPPAGPLRRPRLPRALAVWAAAAVGAAVASANPPSGPQCEARSGATTPTVVELYTSEGCSSCPPADQWLSGLKGRRQVLPLAFHVTYWDRLGWPDRFGSESATQRQYAWSRAHGAAGVYTPQVIVDGQDWRRWPSLPAAARPAPLTIRLHRDGRGVHAELGAWPGPVTGRRLAGYWAVVEDAHASRVTAGENRGETLRHDHVVRLYQPLPAWPASQPQRFSLAVLPGVPDHPRRVVLVVADPATMRPLQALALNC